MDGAERFGVPEALEDLRRHGVVALDEVKVVPLRFDGDKAVVALDWGTGPELVVKVDEPGMVSAVARFHETYGDLPLVPAMRHVDPAHRFLAYDWVAGELGRGMDPPPDKTLTLLALADGLLCDYAPVDSTDAGFFYEPWSKDRRPDGRTWQQFLGLGLVWRDDQVRSHLPPDAGALVRRLAAAPHRRSEGPLHLLHGDCGAHNFVFHEGRLSAVIDPFPLAGEPVFELAFAFASWPHDLTLDAIVPAAEALERAGRWRPPPRAFRRFLIEEVVIALYSRVGTFVVNRPADVPAYVDAWAYWADLLARA